MIFGEYFEWDEAKEASSLAKHGVPFPEAVAAFADLRRLILPDLGHSRVELSSSHFGRRSRQGPAKAGTPNGIGRGFWCLESRL